MEEEHVFAHFYFPNDLKDDALGEFAFVIAIPKNFRGVTIERYVHYYGLDGKNGLILSPDNFIRKMMEKGCNCLSYYGVNLKKTKKIDEFFPYPKPLNLDVLSYNVGIVKASLDIFLERSVRETVHCTFLTDIFD